MNLLVYFVLLSGVLNIRAKAKIDIIFSNINRDIRKFQFGSKNYSTILEHLADAKALDYDYESNLLFYVLLKDQDQSVIEKAKLSDPRESRSVVVEGRVGVNLFEGIAVDWVTKKLYSVDSQRNRIEVCNYDGSNRRVIVWKGLDQPKGIAILPNLGYMFVSDWGDLPQILRFNMDGTNAVSIVKKKIKMPYSIAVDTKTNLVYWGDSHQSYLKIQSMTVDGQLKRLYQVDVRPFYISVFDGHLFWTDADSKIYWWKENDDAKRWIEFENSDDISPYGIQIFSADKQKKFTSKCNEQNGGCSHLCLLSGNSTTCNCPTGHPLNSNKKTCDKIEKFLLIGRKKDLRLMSLEVNEYIDVVLPVNGMKHASGIDYDVQGEKVYWADSDTKTINRAFLNGTGMETVVSTDLQQPAHVAIDWIARQLYWTDPAQYRIEVSRLDGSARKTIVFEYNSEPKGITVDPIRGRLYWSVWRGKNETQIKASYLDGSRPEVLVKESMQGNGINGISYDRQRSKVYWVNAGFKEIAMFDIKEKKKSIITTKTSHPFCISVLGDYVYWTDWFRSVTRLNILDQEEQYNLVDGESMADVMGLKAVDTRIVMHENVCSRSNCTHLCFFNSTQNTPFCACPTRMELANDAMSCGVPSGFLLYSDNEEIYQLSTSTYRKPKILPINFHSPQFLQVLYNESRVFWSELVYSRDSISFSIHSAFLNGSDHLVIARGLDKVYGLSIDWMARNIYWANERLEVARVDGSYRKVLLHDPNTIVTSLVTVNPIMNVMLWFSQAKDYWQLWRANLDGSSKRMLLSDLDPLSCTIDFATGNLYYVNGLSEWVIKCYDVRSNKECGIVRSGLQSTFPFLAFEGNLIYSNVDHANFVQLSLSEGGEPTQLSDGVHTSNQIFDVKAFHPSVQQGWNVCSQKNGGCEQLCFALNNSTPRCACGAHYTLNDDARTCRPPINYLLFNDKTAFLRLLADVKDIAEATLPPSFGKNKPTAIEFDEVRKLIYWLDVDHASIMRTDDQGNHYKKFSLLDHRNITNRPRPCDFALDQFANAIYWTDSNDNSIKFLHLETMHNGTLMKRENFYPRNITVFPELGKMFWTSVNAEYEKTTIMSAELTGNNVIALGDPERRTVVDLALDYTNRRLYWLGTDTVGSMTLSGKSKYEYTIKHFQSKLVSVAVYKQYIFYSDRGFIYRRLWKKDNETLTEKFHSSHDLADLVAVNVTRGLDPHPCLVNNGNCSHICTIAYDLDLSPTTTKVKALCACPKFHTLVDNHKCKEAEHGGCGEMSLYCVEEGICIDQSKVCNFKDDCSSGIDEDSCDYHRQPCASGYIECGKGCIIGTKECDGHSDCPEETDEFQCDLCGASKFSCKEDKKTCLDNSKRCNGEHDCVDFSDEHGCGNIEQNRTVQSTSKPKIRGTRVVAGIISGIIVCLILLMFGVILFMRCQHSKKNAAREQDRIWSLAQLNNDGSSTSEGSQAKGSVVTYISSTSQATTNDTHSYYDRNNVTGQSGSSVLSGYSHVPQNPHPSPLTERAFSVMSDTNTYMTAYNPNCDMCLSIPEESDMSQLHGAPPPTLASMEDVDMYCPYDDKPILWPPTTSSQQRCQYHSKSNGRSKPPRRSLYKKPRFGGGSSEQRQWLCETDTDFESTYGAQPLMFDPPPTPCTNYMSEEDRPNSPGGTEVSIPPYVSNKRLIGGTHYAPPPSPTSQM